MTLKIPPNDYPHPVIYYPPYNPTYSGSSIEVEKLPCIVNIHGGPTGLEKQGSNWTTQYFTSRGWGWCDISLWSVFLDLIGHWRLTVNYGGSSGYGREYIERLARNWGVVDVQDSIIVAQTFSSPPYDLIDNNDFSCVVAQPGDILSSFHYPSQAT